MGEKEYVEYNSSLIFKNLGQWIIVDSPDYVHTFLKVIMKIMPPELQHYVNDKGQMCT